ncbi:MAG: efflux RND transporter periplasmic adaptor subunit [Desulfovermiculus sp.]
MKKIFSFLLAWMTLIPAIGWAAQGTEEDPPPLVQVAPVQLLDATQAEKYIGHVEAIESVDLRVRVEGYLQEVNFQEGSFVQEGQLLYVIEQAPYKAHVASARAKLNQAEANLFKTKTRLRRLRSAQPESVPQTDLDDAQAAADLAKAEVQEAKSSLELAKIDLEYTTIEAPMDGRIGKSFYKKGDLVGASSGPLAEIVSIDPIRVLFSVSDRDIDMMKEAFADAHSQNTDPDLAVRIKFPDQKAYPHQGTIDFIDNKMDPQTGTIAVWARFENPKGQLVPGQYVNVFVQSAEAKMQPAVSQAAVQRDREGDFVFVVNKGNIVEKQRIKTGKVKDGKVMVTSGLQKGELVIIQGIQKAAPEKRVNIEIKDAKDS